MRKKFIAGNWKMNLNKADSVALARGISEQLGDATDVDVAICPPAIYLDAVSQALSGSKVSLGAQNMYHEASGAFTGEIAAGMLQDVCCKYVILGHSERRHVLGESDEAINQQVQTGYDQ